VKGLGANTSGTLGNGETTDSATPVKVKGLTEATAISAGAYHSLALLANGTVKAWGLNTAGGLGDGTTTQRNEPVSVSGLSDVTAVSAGGDILGLGDFSAAIVKKPSEAPKVMTWGKNNLGELGDEHMGEPGETAAGPET